MFPVGVLQELRKWNATWILLSLAVKRCHDRDRSAWFLLVGLIPVIGWLWPVIEVKQARQPMAALCILLYPEAGSVDRFSSAESVFAMLPGISSPGSSWWSSGLVFCSSDSTTRGPHGENAGENGAFASRAVAGLTGALKGAWRGLWLNPDRGHGRAVMARQS